MKQLTKEEAEILYMLGFPVGVRVSDEVLAMVREWLSE